MYSLNVYDSWYVGKLDEGTQGDLIEHKRCYFLTQEDDIIEPWSLSQSQSEKWSKLQNIKKKHNTVAVKKNLKRAIQILLASFA